MCLNYTNVVKVYIDTNGFFLKKDNFLDNLNKMSLQYQKEIVLKISVNYYLMEVDQKHLEDLEQVLEPYSTCKFLSFLLSIRCRTPIKLDAPYLQKLKKLPYLNSLQKIFHALEYTGRGKD